MIRRLRREDGFAVAASIIVLLIGLLLTTAAVGEALSTHSTVKRDGSSKRALQAAQAGLEASANRLTALSDGLRSTVGQSQLCPAWSGTSFTFQNAPLTYGGVHWCSPLDDQIGAGETARTYVSADQDALHLIDQRDIVATGSAAGVDRRAKTTWASFDITQLFGDYTVFSDKTLTLQGQADVGTAQVDGNVRSNADINLSSPNTSVFGDAVAGPSNSVEGSGTVLGDRSIATDPLMLAPVDMSQAFPNDNANLPCAPGCTGGTYLPDLTLSMNNTTVVGNTFALCSLTISGTGNPTITFQAADQTKPVRIFIQAPSQCGGGHTTSVNVASGPTVKLVGPSLQIYVVGNPTNPTTINISNNYVAALPITVYAPQSTVSVDNHGTFNGGIAAGQVTISNNTTIVWPSTGGPALDFNVTPVITRGDFIECTPATTPTVQGC